MFQFDFDRLVLDVDNRFRLLFPDFLFHFVLRHFFFFLLLQTLFLAQAFIPFTPLSGFLVFLVLLPFLLFLLLSRLFLLICGGRPIFVVVRSNVFLVSILFVYLGVGRDLFTAPSASLFIFFLVATAFVPLPMLFFLFLLLFRGLRLLALNPLHLITLLSYLVSQLGRSSSLFTLSSLLSAPMPLFLLLFLALPPLFLLPPFILQLFLLRPVTVFLGLFLSRVLLAFLLLYHLHPVEIVFFILNFCFLSPPPLSLPIRLPLLRLGFIFYTVFRLFDVSRIFGGDFNFIMFQFDFDRLVPM